jgi:hypothetical protein
VEADVVDWTEGNIARECDSTGVLEQGTHARIPQEPGRPRRFLELKPDRARHTKARREGAPSDPARQKAHPSQLDAKETKRRAMVVEESE